MEEKNIENIGNSLTEGLTNSYINNYIITANPNEIINAGDTGDIIVFVSNGKGIFNQDKEKSDDLLTPFTDIYIGNEHIAGGFGFKDINTRDNVLKNIARLEETTNTHYEILNSEITNIRESKSNPIQVHAGKRFIKMNNGDEYELAITTNNILYFVKHHRATINDIEIRYYLNDEKDMIRTIDSTSDDINISVFDTMNIIGFSVVVEASDNISRLDLNYIMPNLDDDVITGEGKTITIGNFNVNAPVYQIHEEFFKLPENAEEQKYVWLERFDIDLKDENGNLKPYAISAVNHNNYDFQFKVNVKTDKFDSSSFYTNKLSFTNPVFYFNHTNEHAIINDLSLLNDIDFVKIDEENTVVINHGETASYGFIMIPYYFVNELYDISFYYEDQLVIKTDFDLCPDVRINNTDVDYKQYRTPHKYTGVITWRFKLTPKFI